MSAGHPDRCPALYRRRRTWEYHRISNG
jgi:hypothetical protein